MDEQVHMFFKGHTGHVSISWHICNNVNEMYDSSKHDGRWGEMPALDGSLLYVWVNLHLTDIDLERRVQDNVEYFGQLSDEIYMIAL